jgi:hypothetical protein
MQPLQRMMMRRKPNICIPISVLSAAFAREPTSLVWLSHKRQKGLRRGSGSCSALQVQGVKDKLFGVAPNTSTAFLHPLIVAYKLKLDLSSLYDLDDSWDCSEAMQVALTARLVD